MIKAESLGIDTMPCLPGMEGMLPALDDEAILDGSNAKWGFRQAALQGEVFLYEGRNGGPVTLEIYKHDGKDQPIKIRVEDFNYSDEEVLYAIKLALEQNSIGDM